jgi:hypothetical protein
MVQNNGIFLTYFKYISKYSQNELLTPCLHLNHLIFQ